MVESFNAMLLKYASKRHGFDYENYKARCQLATIDHNFHVHRPFKLSKDGRLCYSKNYVKRSKTWRLVLTKVAKNYPYKNTLLGKIFQLINADQQAVTKGGNLQENNPKTFAKTIAIKEPVDTDVLYMKIGSRMNKKPSVTADLKICILESINSKASSP